jgi:hypothetical protein
MVSSGLRAISKSKTRKLKHKYGSKVAKAHPPIQPKKWLNAASAGHLLWQVLRNRVAKMGARIKVEIHRS